MADRPCPAWTLQCPWCPWKVVVFARGAHGADPGSGVMAAELGREHAEQEHGRTWGEFLSVRTSTAG